MGISKGQGRVEYLAHKPIIQASLEEGYTLTSIYKKLKTEGKITLSYPRLAGLVANEKSKMLQKTDLRKKSIIAIPRETRSDTSPRIIRAEEKENPFRQKRTHEELYKELIG